MTATTTTTHTDHRLPARVVQWTRLGAGMGYTDTETKRAAIRAAVEHDGLDRARPSCRDVLDAAPVRFFVRGLLYGRMWAFAAAAVAPLPDGICPDPFKTGRLIGIRTVTGERWVLLDLGYEAIDLLHDHPHRYRGGGPDDGHDHQPPRPVADRRGPLLDGPADRRGRNPGRCPAHRPPAPRPPARATGRRRSAVHCGRDAVASC